MRRGRFRYGAQRAEKEPAVVQRRPGEADRQLDPDAHVAKQFGTGCLVLLVAFLLLTAAVWWFWMH